MNNFPTKWFICDRCEGEGKVAHEAFSNGITSSEWNDSDQWDDESKETYMRGGYDVSCPQCKGLGREKLPDREQMTPQQIRRLDRVEAVESIRAAQRAEDERTRRMESGGYYQ